MKPAPASYETGAVLSTASATSRSLVGGAGVRHVGGNDPRVELLGRQEAELESGLAQRQALVMRVLRDLRGLVVADVAVQCRHLHEVDVQVVLDLLVVGLDAVRAVRIEGHAGVAQQADGLQDVPGHDGLEDVELEVALRAGKADRRVVAEHLGGDHGHGLALGRVDLARHDGRARLVLGDDQLADAVTRTGGVPAHVVRDLHEGVGQDAQRARNQHQRVVRAQGGEQVVGLLELDAGLLGDLLGGELAELRVSVQAGAHGGAADGQLARTGVRVLDAVEGEVDLSNSSRK